MINTTLPFVRLTSFLILDVRFVAFYRCYYAILDGEGFEDRCSRKATKILGARGATQEFGKQASKVEMRGEIVRKEAATKWVVRWDKPLSESAWNARSLTREDDNEAADEGPDISITSNDESSDSDEAPDVVEHV